MLDLSIGSPDCMKVEHTDYVPTQHVSDLVGYPDPEGKQSLKDVIKLLHQHVGNVSDLRQYEVVVGNSASQLLQAALASFEDNYVETLVYAHPPYFSRFPDFVKLSGRNTFKFTKKIDETNNARLIEIVTLPNNPDNESSYARTSGSSKIYDCSYLWPQYSGAVLPAGVHNILVFSLAKALGLAGVRMGWALVHDHGTAKRMRQFIETQAGGVSRMAQDMAESAIEDEATGYSKSMKEMGDILQTRWSVIKDKFKEIRSYGLINRSGMFLWIKTPRGADLMDATLGIKSAHGKAFGVTDEYARLNLACDEASFNILVDRLDRLR